MRKVLVAVLMAASVFVGGVAVGGTLPGTSQGRTSFETPGIRVKLAGTDLHFTDRGALGEYIRFYADNVIDGEDRGFVTLTVRKVDGS